MFILKAELFRFPTQTRNVVISRLSLMNSPPTPLLSSGTLRDSFSETHVPMVMSVREADQRGRQAERELHVLSELLSTWGKCADEDEDDDDDEESVRAVKSDHWNFYLNFKSLNFPLFYSKSNYYKYFKINLVILFFIFIFIFFLTKIYLNKNIFLPLFFSFYIFGKIKAQTMSFFYVLLLLLIQIIFRTK